MHEQEKEKKLFAYVNLVLRKRNIDICSYIVLSYDFATAFSSLIFSRNKK